MSTGRDRLNDCLYDFTKAMRQRLHAKTGAGYTGWDSEDLYDLMWDKLHKHVKLAEEGSHESYVDIANLAMFLHGLKVYK